MRRLLVDPEGRRWKRTVTPYHYMKPLAFNEYVESMPDDFRRGRPQTTQSLCIANRFVFLEGIFTAHRDVVSAKLDYILLHTPRDTTSLCIGDKLP